MYQAQLEGTSGHYSRPPGEEVETDNVFEEGTFAAGLGAQHCDPGEGDFLIESVVTDFVDDVDQFADISEEVGLEEVALS